MTIREPFPLPIKEPQKRSLTIFQERVCAVIRSQAVKVVSGQTTDFDKEISDIVVSIWQDGYSLGLGHMDKLHKQIDAMIEKSKKYLNEERPNKHVFWDPKTADDRKL